MSILDEIDGSSDSTFAQRSLLMARRYQRFAKEKPPKPTPPREGTDDPKRSRPKPMPRAALDNPRLGLPRLF